MSLDKIERGLNKAFLRTETDNTIPLQEDSKYVVFSDHHRGGRNRADDFQPAEENYLNALNHYYDNDWNLILLGDMDELWEEKPATVVSKYSDVLEREALFAPDRLIRVFGNHDRQWGSRRYHDRYLKEYFPENPAVEGIIFTYSDDDISNARIFLTHGHQGTFGSDAIAPLSRFIVRVFYRQFQKLTGKGRTPSTNECLRGEHDTKMYEWAYKRHKLILIAGHTHRPVWSSRTHLEKLTDNLMDLVSLPQSERPADYETQLADLKAQVKKRKTIDPPCNDTIKTAPCYFNTGCCRFEDGDITGIEIDGGDIRLMKWDSDTKERIILEQSTLRAIFTVL